MITKQDLEQLRGLKLELESLINTKPVGQEVLIFYKDYRKGYGVPKMDRGVDDGESMAEELAKKIRTKHRVILRQVNEVEDWLDQIKDPVMRTILRYYYLDGKTQQEIGDITGYSRERIGKKIQGFWLEEEKGPQRP